MKDFLRTSDDIVQTKYDQTLKWVESLTPGGMMHFGIEAEGDSVEELIRAGDIVTFTDPSVVDERAEKISTEVVEIDGTLYLSDGETELDSVTVWELWIKKGLVMSCVAVRNEDEDKLILIRN